MNVDAEQNIVALALQENCGWAIDLELPAEFFHRPHLRAIWLAIVSDDRDEDAYGVALAASKRKNAEFGITDLSELALDAPPSRAAASVYADEIRTAHYNRSLDAAARAILERNPHTTAMQASEDAIRSLEQLRLDCTQTAYRGGEAARAHVPTRCIDIGLGSLGELIPLAPGQLCVLAARPGNGKTSLAQAIARKIAREHGKRVLFVTLEMSAYELTMRSIAADFGLPYLECLRSEQLADLVRQRAQEDEDPIIYEQTRYRRLGEISSSVRRHRPDLVVIDYLGMISRERQQSEIDFYSNAIRTLNDLAERAHVPVLCLSQINRASVTKDRNGIVSAPTLADIVGSSVIEATADSVLLLHRHSCYYPGERRGELDVHLAKNRHGDVGIATLQFDASRLRWRN